VGMGCELMMKNDEEESTWKGKLDFLITTFKQRVGCFISSEANAS